MDLMGLLDGKPFQIPILLEGHIFKEALIDSGCECFSAISESVAKELGCQLIQIPTRKLRQAAMVRVQTEINLVACFKYDIEGFQNQAVAYVIPGLTQDMILGRPWMEHVGATLDPQQREVVLREAGGLVVKECAAQAPRGTMDVVTEFALAKLLTREGDPEMDTLVTTSLWEITRILNVETQLSQNEERTEDGGTLPRELEKFRDLFDKEKASALPPHRGRSDHHIKLQPGKSAPWGPLYGMEREKLVELRRQLHDLLDKGWIRASSSPAGAPVLLAKKPGGGWRLCVDYRGLNAVTDQDRYPLPLIKETLRMLAKATWFSKVDIRAAFHKIRMAKGQEELTAFRTRFGLFEWLVCPFGLTGAPATFQRYINTVLKDALGVYATAYLDDVLIYSTGSRKDHMAKVESILGMLQDAGLNVDLRKCKFAAKEVKYVGYIIEAGVAIRPDPEKLRAVRDWEPPRTVRQVRGFLGFANFYRDFIPEFSRIAEPLHELTRKGVTFRWSEAHEKAFQRLKAAFISGPILTQWDPDRKTVVEADCSGTAIGACLSQYDKGVLYPVAYFSASLSAAEKNYTIHDKELLAIVRATKEWRAELQSVATPFTILTDHKNLTHFTKVQELSGRQHRWSEWLSMFRFELEFRPGRLAGRPDGLSRRGQDAEETGRLSGSLMTPIQVRRTRTTREATTDELPKGENIFAEDHLQQLWDEAVRCDDSYLARLRAVKGGASTFPEEARTANQIGDCTVNAQGAILWRGGIMAAELGTPDHHNNSEGTRVASNWAPWE